MILIKQTDTGLDIHMEGSAGDLIIELTLAKRKLYQLLEEVPREEIDGALQRADQEVNEAYEKFKSEKIPEAGKLAEETEKAIIEGL